MGAIILPQCHAVLRDRLTFLQNAIGAVPIPCSSVLICARPLLRLFVPASACSSSFVPVRLHLFVPVCPCQCSFAPARPLRRSRTSLSEALTKIVGVCARS
jgi:hypothetical protein